MGKHHTLSWWRDAVTAWLASGQTAGEYAKVLKVDASTLRSYRRRFGLPWPEGAQAEPVRLVHVEVEPETMRLAPTATSLPDLPQRLLARVGLAELEVPVGIDPLWTAALIAAIGKASAAC